MNPNSQPMPTFIPARAQPIHPTTTTTMNLSRTPSLISSRSRVSSPDSEKILSDDLDDHHHALVGVDWDTGSEDRPRLTRTISLPVPPTPTLLHRTPPDLDRPGQSRIRSDHEEPGLNDTLMGMTGLHLSSSPPRPTMEESFQNVLHHRRTVSTSAVNRSAGKGSNRVYRFGGKEFVPLRMEAFEARARMSGEAVSRVGLR